MIFFYVFLGFILFLLVLLCCPVKVHVSFKNFLNLKVKFLFFSFDLIPAKKNNSEVKKAEEIQSKSHDDKFLIQPEQLAVEEKKDEKVKLRKYENKILSIIKEEGFFGFLKILKLIANILFNSTKKILEKIHINSFELYLLVAKDNAADTAIDYARIYALISYAVSVLLQNVNKRKCYVEVAPGFDATECEVDFSSKFYFFPISMLGIALGALCKFVKNMYFNTVSERM